ncbi:MAG TPA: RNA polymerase sigma factor [Solirubrobacteraceae bacterium]|jgi:RNA polymerase sigma-70 factor (ECF subfamily)
MADTGEVEGTRNDAFERLYAEHAQALFGFLSYRTNDPVLAEDLLADTYERVLRARRRFDPRKASEKTWLYTIALNCLTDHFRRRATESRALEHIAAGPGSAGESWGVDETDLLDEVTGSEDGGGDVLNRSLALLHGPERQVIALRFGADLSIAEIAKLTGEPPTTIEGRIYRALGKLREALD